LSNRFLTHLTEIIAINSHAMFKGHDITHLQL